MEFNRWTLRTLRSERQLDGQLERDTPEILEETLPERHFQRDTPRDPRRNVSKPEVQKSSSGIEKTS